MNRGEEKKEKEERTMFTSANLQKRGVSAP